MQATVPLVLCGLLLSACAGHSGAPGEADRLAREGHKLAEQGRQAAASEKLERALALEPEHAAASFDRGQIRLGQGLLTEALADLDRAVKGAPDNPRYLGARCVARAIATAAEEALDDCRKALAQPGSKANAIAASGQANLALQRNQAALRDFEVALKAYPNHMRALYGRGVARLRLGDARGTDDQQLAVSRLPGAGREYVLPALR